MLYEQNQKVVCTQLQTIATNATSAVTVDTTGWDYCIYDVYHNPSTASNSSAKWTSLVLQEATTTDTTNATAIDGCTGTTNATATSAQFVLPVHNDTSIGSVVRFFVPLHNKAKIIRCQKQAAASHHHTCEVIHLMRGRTGADTDTERGVNVSVVAS